MINLDDERKFVTDKKNCPNCGAPIESEKCPYCGTYFIDFASIEMNKPFWMKLKRSGEVYTVPVVLTRMETTQINDGYKTHITMEFDATPATLKSMAGVHNSVTHLVIKV